MSTAAPPPAPGRPDGGAGAAVPATPAASAPTVVAVMVTRNAGDFLEESLAALGAQDYPALTVLVVDAGSRQDPTARVGAALPTAFVRRVAGDPGFGGAANDVLAAVEGATFFLVCHDDVALDPDAVQVMVGEAYRSNAAIIGPKLVEAEDPEVLLDVGRAIDRLGGSHTGIELGEVDQEQHDGVRDVFYVSSAAMLVRADLFRELEGFDPDTFPGSEDLDLCWRARLAGARVMVAPDARARHHEAAGLRADADFPDVREVARAACARHPDLLREDDPAVGPSVRVGGVVRRGDRLLPDASPACSGRRVRRLVVERPPLRSDPTRAAGRTGAP